MSDFRFVFVFFMKNKLPKFYSDWLTTGREKQPRKTPLKMKSANVTKLQNDEKFLKLRLFW